MELIIVKSTKIKFTADTADSTIHDIFRNCQGDLKIDVKMQEI